MKNLQLISFLMCVLLWPINAEAQPPKTMTSSEIHEAIKKLNVLGSIMYIAAHPDDENTRLISYFANERMMETTYLSMTRGDGGQNLIGPEMAELLGVIRTQELLAARRIDGGHQLFTRANDFGYSKSPIETMEIWNKAEVLSDVVYNIRKVQPDIIINRFSNDLNSRTHGHHTASAVLSTEAYYLTGNSNSYSDQLKYVKPWQPQRLFFNTSWWFYGSRENFEKADKSKMLGVDTGVYYPMKGKSNSEIASDSRSQHKCQGMGNTRTRGTNIEYMAMLEGIMPVNKEDPFDGINTTWSRLSNAEHIAGMVDDIDRNFNYAKPSKSISELLLVKREIENLDESKWKKIKLEEIQEIILQCAGLYAEFVASNATAAPGEQLQVDMEMINRSEADVKVARIQVGRQGSMLDSTVTLFNNEQFRHTFDLTIPSDAHFSNAYWLEKKGTLGMYTVDDQRLRGLPETPRSTLAAIALNINGSDMIVVKPVIYKKTDPVKAEVYRPFEIAPAVHLRTTENVYVFGNDKSKQVEVLVKAGKDDLKGTVKLESESGNWSIEPASIDVSLQQKGEEQIVKFTVTPPAGQEETELMASIDVDGRMYNWDMTTIEYDHIPAQMVLSPAKSKIVRVNLNKEGNRIAYIMGAGDEVPASLEQIGYDVNIINPDEISYETLRHYDAVILGVRAFNTVDRLKFKNDELFKFVEKGGNLIIQFNTSRGLVTEDLAPFPMKLSRDRVSLENAEIRILKPEHPVLKSPNKITSADFEGWVQERGLYFPGEWSGDFDAILSSNDPGEDPKDGGLLIAKYGEGYYIYTGYAWFRQLPAGVPGAYRMFTNMISLGKRNRS